MAIMRKVYEDIEKKEQHLSLLNAIVKDIEVEIEASTYCMVSDNLILNYNHYEDLLRCKKSIEDTLKAELSFHQTWSIGTKEIMFSWENAGLRLQLWFTAKIDEVPEELLEGKVLEVVDTSESRLRLNSKESA